MRTVEEQLEQDGFAVLPDRLTVTELERLRARVEQLWALEGEQAGSEFRQEPGTRRLANLGDKGKEFLELASRAEVLGLVGQVLGERFKISSINARSAEPNANSHQPLHVDQGLLPDERGNSVCNVVWMLDDFTADNGALRAVPGTHKSGQNPAVALADASAPHPGEVLITGKAGTAVVMNAHLWHGGTANRSGKPRRAIHCFYCRWDKPQQQYQKRLLRAETQAALTAAERALLAIDDAENDRLSSAITNQSGFLR